MSIFKRVSRLFKADIHGILDELEEPDVVLRQAVREMREVVEKTETRIKLLERQHEQLNQSKTGSTDQLQELEQQIGFCFDQKNETLAKSMIRKKLQLEKTVKVISEQIGLVMDEKTILGSELDERKDKLNSTLDKLELFAVSNKTEREDKFELTGNGVNCNTVTQDDVEFVFLQEKQKYLSGATQDSEGEGQ